MTLLEAWVQTYAAKALGWTLFHSLWEGAIVAAALAIALRVVRSSRHRHLAACLALVAVLAGFGLTLGRLMQHTAGGSALIAQAIPPAPGGFAEATRSQTLQHAADLLPWLGPFWIAGVLIFHLRSLAGWMTVRRLRRTGVCCAPPIWQERLTRLSARLKTTRPVALLESCLADVPMVAGYLRPVILMPVGLLTGLSAGQIESILLHELAHIRRYDDLINLLQSFAEGLLFYHPAVWWISGVIRAAREECCDDMVVATTGDAQEYATALAVLETNSPFTLQAGSAARRLDARRLGWNFSNQCGPGLNGLAIDAREHFAIAGISVQLVAQSGRSVHRHGPGARRL
jgi:beta-lactamase regulating signal transducer with metallopeptidase domain